MFSIGLIFYILLSYSQYSLMEAVVVKAICYHNTKITLPYWAPNSRLNEECPLGFAYEDGDFYIHNAWQGEGFYFIRKYI